MSSDDTGELVGRSTDEAVAVVLDREGDADREAVRAALSRVSDDGVVTQSAIDDAVAHVSKVVATPENRTEMAERAHDEAVGAAEPVADLGAVRSRLDTFGARRDDVVARTEAVVADLQSLVEREGRDAYAVGREAGRLAETANRVHRDADELLVDLETFQEWLDDPEARATELGEDAEAIGASLDELDEWVASLNAGVDWYHVTLRHRVLELLAADARSELADLRAWPGDAAAGSGLDDVATRLGRVEDRLDDTATRLEAAPEPAWRERFDERLAEAEADLDAFDPPIHWGGVEEAVESYRVDAETA